MKKTRFGKEWIQRGIVLAIAVAALRVTSGQTELTKVRGGLTFEAYFDIGGNSVQSIFDDFRYPNEPDLVQYVTEFTSRLVFPDSSHENYGGRMYGWIVPPESGEYEFFIRSDDGGQLYLSLDDNPANAFLIAEETGCCGPFEEPGAPETAFPTALTAGKRYYIEALWKEGGGGDYCDVAWRKVGDPAVPRNLSFIPGSVLETLAIPGTFTPPQISISSPASGSTFDPGQAVTVTVAATSTAPKTIVKVELLEAGKILGEATASPFAISLDSLSEDVHSIVARVTDSAGLFKVSEPITVTLGGQVEKITFLAIDDKTRWRYDRSGEDLGTEWRENNFDDSAWPQGTALIADEGTTTVEPIRTPISRFNDAGNYVQAFFFRAHFTFSGEVTPSVKLQLRHVVDDGAVFYLNGVEIHRFGIAAGVEVDYLTNASGHENAYEGPYEIDLSSLVSGDNVLAAEVHQSGGSSSDMVFGAELIATIPGGSAPVAPKFSGASRSGNNIVVEWTGSGRLQSADTITGPWTDVATAASPYSAAISGGAKFFRLRQ